MKSLSESRLYTFIDTAYLHGRSPAELAKQLCDGGSDLIQLRAKTSSEAEIQKMAEAIAPICREAGVRFVVNDYWQVAKNVNADFVHLGQEDFFDAGLTHVNQLPIGNHQLQVGLSSHAPSQAERAASAGADYIAIGPIYATGTKPTAKPVTLEYVRWASKNVKLPWFAIGGITLRNLDEILSAGVTRICIVSAILNAIDIVQACQAFKKALPK